MQLIRATQSALFEKRVQDGLGLLEECAKWKYFELKAKGVSVEKSELITIGYMGLHKAVQIFDDKKNNDFHGFAKYHINLAILTYQRNIDELDHRVRKQIKQILNVRENLQQSLGREPSITEIAEKTNIEEGKVESLLTLSPGYVDINNNSSEEYAESMFNEIEYEHKEQNDRLGKDMSDCIDTALTADQKQIIELLYFEEKSVEEISVKLWHKFDTKKKTFIYNATKNGKIKLKNCMAEKGWSIADV